jgi:hypothetical protein
MNVGIATSTTKLPGIPTPTQPDGSVINHYFVLVYMPEAGKVNCSVAAVNCGISFPNVKFAIVVGVCGVIPFVPNCGNEHQEIILGDMIVSQDVV